MRHPSNVSLHYPFPGMMHYRRQDDNRERGAERHGHDSSYTPVENPIRIRNIRIMSAPLHGRIPMVSVSQSALRQPVESAFSAR